MPVMRSPYVGKPVTVPANLVAQFLKNGYEVVEDKTGNSVEKKSAQPRRT